MAKPVLRYTEKDMTAAIHDWFQRGKETGREEIRGQLLKILGIEEVSRDRDILVLAKTS